MVLCDRNLIGKVNSQLLSNRVSYRKSTGQGNPVLTVVDRGEPFVPERKRGFICPKTKKFSLFLHNCSTN